MTGPTWLDDEDDDLRIRAERPLPADGQAPRITELWVWTALDPMTDTEGIMAMKTPRGGGLPLVTTMRDMAERMRPTVDGLIRNAQEPRPVAQLRRFIPAPERAAEPVSRPRRDDDYGQGAADA